MENEVNIYILVYGICLRQYVDIKGVCEIQYVIERKLFGQYNLHLIKGALKNTSYSEVDRIFQVSRLNHIVQQPVVQTKQLLVERVGLDPNQGELKSRKRCEQVSVRFDSGCLILDWDFFIVTHVLLSKEPTLV